MSITRDALEIFLTDSCDKFSILDFKSGNDKFSAEVRLTFKNEKLSSNSELCDEWKKQFGKWSKTCWITRKTFPKLQRLQYRKVYFCQHSNVNKTKNPMYKTMPRSRDSGCKASIDLKIKIVTPDTLRKDKFLQNGMGVIVKINFDHTHYIENAEAYSFLKISDECQTAFYNYFEHGMTPYSAKAYHEVLLLSSAEKIMDEADVLANASVNPTVDQIKFIYRKWRVNKYGTRESSSVYDILKEKIPSYEEKGNSLILSKPEDPFQIIVLTSIMKRVHLTKSASEVVFVDSSGSCDQSCSSVTFLFAATKIGAVPLAFIIHRSQSEESYTQAFQALSEELGEHGFGGKKYPEVFMTDDSEAERNALKTCFPKSRLLLCAFHVCQALWRWLWDTAHSIIKEDRKHLMNLFRAVIFEQDETQCEELYEDLMKDVIVQKYDNFRAHMQELWSRRKEWAYSLRSSLSIRGNNTNNFAEASIRIFKDVVLQRCKAFNPCALVEFVVNSFENYHKTRILSFANKRHTANELSYKKFLVKSEKCEVILKEAETYHVRSVTDKELVYTVNTVLGLCDCPKGSTGRFCHHLCAVQTMCGVTFEQCPQLTQDDRAFFAKLALGEIDSKFYRDMSKSKPQQFNEPQPSTSTSESMEYEKTGENDRPKMKQPSPKMMQSISEIELELTRIRNVALKEPTESMEKAMEKIARCLKHIKSPMQLQTFGVTISSSTRQRYIKVQPTSISRRKSRPGFKSGSKRIQSGRPSNMEISSSQSRKRKRSLASNISANRPNAKSH